MARTKITKYKRRKPLGEECHDLICAYHSMKTPNWQKRKRNELFKLLHPYIETWIKNILEKVKVKESEHEITALAWDAFVFCLERFDTEGPWPVIGHFAKFTSYYLAIKHAKDIKREEKQERIKRLYVRVMPILFDANGELQGVETRVGINRLIELINFRDFLPEQYKLVLDELLTGRFVDKNNCWPQAKRSDAIRYYEAKRLLKLIIDYLAGKEKKDGNM